MNSSLGGGPGGLGPPGPARARPPPRGAVAVLYTLHHPRAQILGPGPSIGKTHETHWKNIGKSLENQRILAL